MRKLKTAPETNLPSLSKARLKELIEEAMVDAYTEEEQIVGFLTMIEEHLALPFSVKILGVEAEVEKVDMTLVARLLPFAVEGIRVRRLQSWTCLCQFRRQQAQNGLPLIAAGAEGPGERRPVLRFPRDRPSADEKRDGRATFHLHAGAITATSFTNHYEWGYLKAHPSELLEKYFDAFVYVANWGTHEFYIRLPQESVDYKLLKAMVPGGTVQV